MDGRGRTGQSVARSGWDSTLAEIAEEGRKEGRIGGTGRQKYHDSSEKGEKKEKKYVVVGDM